MNQVGAAAGIGGIEVADPQAEIIGHRHHPARGVARAEIAVDIGLGEARIGKRAVSDLGVKLGSGFVGSVPGRMFVDTGDIGLALDAQLILRWRFFLPLISSGNFLACRDRLGKRRIFRGVRQYRIAQRSIACCPFSAVIARLAASAKAPARLHFACPVEASA